MAMLSDASLRHALEPAVVVMNAFRKASSWRAVHAAWAASKRRDRWCFIGLSVLFISLGVGCVWLNDRWLFGLALIFGVLGIWIFRCRVIDRHPLRHAYGQLDRYFGLNYRFRRYLMFRAQLQSEGIDLNTIDRVKRMLVIEAKLHESRRPKLDSVAGTVVSFVAGLLLALSTQEYLMKSGWTLLIFVICMVALYFYVLWKSIFPGHRHTEQELECFLTWHAEEFAFAKQN
ncbi:hypothetical protein BOTU111921_03485 [Bordetella tumbae]